jgi:hypothetical protein
MSDISFRVQVKPEVVAKYNEEKIDRLANKHGLSKAELAGDGIDLTEADGMQLNTFKKLSAGTGKITQATLVKFDDGNETPAQKIAGELKKTLPSSMVVKGPLTNDASETITVQSKYGNTGNETFTMVGGADSNKDGQLDVGSEINENDLVKTTNDAKELGGKDLKATPEEAVKFFMKKKGVNTGDINVTSEKANPLNTKLNELLTGIEEKK